MEKTIICKYNKVIGLFILVLFSLLFSACTEKEEPCQHESSTWHWEEDAKCNQKNLMYLECDECGLILEEKEEMKAHEYVEETVLPTCTEQGYILTTCKNCKYSSKKYTGPLEHNYEYVIDTEATATTYGVKHKECTACHDKLESIEYALNDYSTHGALHVTGVDLMDSNNQKFRLAGISSFGLQWQPQYINYSTIEALKNTFGINVIRLSLYTAEGGYCECSEAKKETLYQTVCNGIDIATSLNLYVIVDWHMLGAEDERDENPLFYKEEAKLFFDKITKQYSDHDNILFEIMNEPSGATTWAHCKQYAEEVIPVIRNNMPNAIVLVGNPQWTSDLASVAKNPLVGYTNIMYAFHYYAADNTMTSKITTAVGSKGLPVFVTEHGAMDADGDGDLDYTSAKAWYKVLDQYNISFVAWSLANLSSSSCMIRTGSKSLDDFSDSNLKEWGIYYKTRVRTVMGLPTE